MATASEHGTRPAPIAAAGAARGGGAPVLAAACALAAGAGAALATGRWPLVVLALAAAAWGALALRDGPAAATLVVLTLGLPAYAVPWFGDLAPGIGLLTVLVAALLLALALSRDRARAASAAARELAREPAAWAIGAFFAVAAASLVLAPRSEAGLSLLKGYAGQAVALPLLLAVAVVAAGRTRGERLAQRLATVAIGVGVAGGLLAILQSVTARAFLAPAGEHQRVIEAFVGERAIGLAEHPGTWAAFALLPLGIACARWLHAPGRWLGAAVAVIAAGTVLTLARAGWIGLAVAVAAAVVLAAGVPLRRRAALLVLAAVASGLAFGLARVADFPSERPQSVRLTDPRIALEREGRPGGGATTALPGAGALGIADRLGVDRSVTMRLILSRAEIEMGLRRPLTGVGLGRIGEAIPELRPRAVYETRGDLGFVPGQPIDKHNTYAGLFAELGAPGLLAFLLVLGTLALTLARALRAARERPQAAALAAGLLAALAATAVYATFSDADRLPFVWWVAGLALGLGTLARRDRAGGPTPSA